VLDRRPQPSLRRYLRKRALRILPAYWAILLVTCLVLDLGSTPDGVGRLTDPALLASNLLLVQDYRPSTVYTGLGPAWSLAPEVVFYLLLPLLSLLAAAFAGRAPGAARRRAAILAPPLILLVIGWSSKLAAGAWGDGAGEWSLVLFTLFPVHADLFGLGMLVAVAGQLLARARHAAPRRLHRGLLLASAAIACSTVAAGPAIGVAGTGRLTDVAAGGAAAFLVAATCLPRVGTEPGRIVRLLDWRPIAAVGVVSYSLYLWHDPVIRLLDRLGLSATSELRLALTLAATLAIALAASAATWRFVERPALAGPGGDPSVHRQSRVLGCAGARVRRSTYQRAPRRGARPRRRWMGGAAAPRGLGHRSAALRDPRPLYGAPVDPAAERFSVDTWVQRDVCASDPWPFADDQFDFVVCSHTLEDVRDPVRVCEELVRIGRAGYVEVPAPIEDLTFGVHGPWVGWSHHHWISEFDNSGLRFTMKPHLLVAPGRHLPVGSCDGLPPERLVLELWWEGTFPFREQVLIGSEEFDGWLEGLLEATRSIAAPGPASNTQPRRRARWRPHRA